VYVPTQTSGRYDVKAQWAVKDTKDLRAPAMQVEAYLADAIEEGAGSPPESDVPRHWTVKLRRRLSLFDVRDVDVTLEDGEEGCRVVVEVRLDSSETQVGIVLGMTTSIVAAPLVWGWRWQSVRSARAEAHAIAERIFEALAKRETGYAYR
jgi:hypothetical protein